jgi:hypothetical protein
MEEEALALRGRSHWGSGKDSMASWHLRGRVAADGVERCNDSELLPRDSDGRRCQNTADRLGFYTWQENGRRALPRPANGSTACGDPVTDRWAPSVADFQI